MIVRELEKGLLVRKVGYERAICDGREGAWKKSGQKQCW